MNNANMLILENEAEEVVSYQLLRTKNATAQNDETINTKQVQNLGDEPWW